MAATTYGIKAGKAFVLIEAVDATAKVLDQIRNKIGKFGSDIAAVGQTMAFRSAAALTPVALSLKTFASFDDSLRIVEARSKGTAAEMDNLRDMAQRLGATTAFTATHIGQLMARLAQAKKTRKEIGEMTEPITHLARAAAGPEGDLGADIINATDAVTQIMAAYRMGTEETVHITDLLSATVRNSRFSLEELNTALQYGAAAGKAYNVPLEDTITALAGIRDLGYDASIAGTAFRNMMQHVVQKKERDTFNETLKELTGNVIAFTDASGNLKNPIDMLVAIMEATKDLGTAERGDLLTNLFESRATTPAMGLGAAVENIAKMRKALSDVTGDAKRTHDTMETGMGGAFRRIASAAENVAIEIGKALNPTVVALGYYIENTIHHITDWIGKHRGLINTVVATTIGIGALGVSLIVLGQSLRIASAAFLLVSVPLQALGLLLSPGGLLIAGAILLLSMIPGIGTAFTNMATSVGSSLVGLTTSWQTTIQGISSALGRGDIETAFELISLQVQATWKAMLHELLTAWEGFKSNFTASGDLAKLGIQAQIKAKQLELDFIKANPQGREDYRQKAIERLENEIQSLKNSIIQAEAEMTGPAAARIAEITELNQKLRELQQREAQKSELAFYMGGSSSSTLPVPDFSAELEKLKEDAAKLITPGEAAADSTQRHAITGAEKGSVAAAQAFQENKFNAMKTALDTLVAVEVEAKGHLEKIDRDIAKIANRDFGMYGV